VSACLLAGAVGVAADEQYARPGVRAGHVTVVALVGRRSSRGPAASAAARRAGRVRVGVARGGRGASLQLRALQLRAPANVPGATVQRRLACAPQRCTSFPRRLLLLLLLMNE